MKKVKVKAVMTHMGTGEHPCYRLVTLGTTKVNEQEVLARLAKITGTDEVRSRYWLDAFQMVLFDALSNNECVDLSFLIAKLFASGSIKGMGDQPTKSENPVVGFVGFKGAFAEKLAQIETENDTVTVAAILYELKQDGETEKNRISSTTARIVLNGREIKVDAAQEDNGVWLESIETGVKLVDAEVLYSDAVTCDFKFPTLPPTGKYRLVLATRNGESPEEYALARATRNVYVKNEED